MYGKAGIIKQNERAAEKERALKEHRRRQREEKMARFAAQAGISLVGR
jgi:hypothetical protein